MFYLFWGLLHSIIFPDDAAYAAGRDVRSQEEDNVGMSQPPQGPQLVEQWQTAQILMKRRKQKYLYDLYPIVLYIYMYICIYIHIYI